MFFPALPANEERKQLVSQRYGDAETFTEEQHGALICPQPAEKRTKTEAEMTPKWTTRVLWCVDAPIWSDMDLLSFFLIMEIIGRFCHKNN